MELVAHGRSRRPARTWTSNWLRTAASPDDRELPARRWWRRRRGESRVGLPQLCRHSLKHGERFLERAVV
jgi:hypothetical protein